MRPRLSVHFSGKHIYVQVVDDDKGVTLLSACTTEKNFSNVARSNKSSAAEVGKIIAERARARKIGDVVFDRGGFRYHGRIKALADAARAGGLLF